MSRANAKIIEKNLFKEGIDINNLQEEARQKGFFDLNKINVYNAYANYNASTGEFNVGRQVSNLPMGNLFFSIKIDFYRHRGYLLLIPS